MPFKKGNNAAVYRDDRAPEYSMTATEFKYWRLWVGWSVGRTARQLGLDPDDVRRFETRGHIPGSLKTICERIACQLNQNCGASH